jgi:16S rRNA G527 N7-methylase RsmG
MNPVDYRQQIRSGLDALSLEYSEGQLDRLDAYLSLLHKWNRAYNLTAVRDPTQMIGRHLLDSLAVAPWLQGTHFADVGTGAGLPGIPLAIMRPSSRFELIDSNGKKIRFVTQVINCNWAMRTRRSAGLRIIARYAATTRSHRAPSPHWPTWRRAVAIC